MAASLTKHSLTHCGFNGNAVKISPVTRCASSPASACATTGRHLPTTFHSIHRYPAASNHCN